MNYTHRFFSCALAAILTFSQTSLIAQAPSSATTTPAASPAPTKPATVFKPEELEQLAAPIALYPDPLIAQVLMASTYPLEVVLAARWMEKHPELKGEAATKAVEKEEWDPAVKSLVVFPDVLKMMNAKIDWTQKLGDAFLAQQKEVMDAVQRLRARAKDAGNLKSNDQMAVKTEPAPAGSTTTQTIIIESKNPEVVYVPTYDPMVMYGAWPYAAYPPYYYYPPGYVAGAAFFSFTAGVIVGGALWGNCNWGGGDININRNTNINNINNRGNTNIGNRGGGNSWQHNPEHRRGAEYRDAGTQQKFGRASSQQGAQAREQFRGRAEQGRQDLARSGGAQSRDLGGTSRDFGGGAQSRDLGGSNRDFGGGAQSRDLGGSSRDFGGSAQSRDLGGSSRGGSSRSSSSSAFGGGSGASARASSSRGGMSRGGGGGGRRR